MLSSKYFLHHQNDITINRRFMFQNKTTKSVCNILIYLYTLIHLLIDLVVQKTISFTVVEYLLIHLNCNSYCRHTKVKVELYMEDIEEKL